MKYIWLIAALCMLQKFSFAQEEERGIEFFHGSWEEILAEAQKQDKPIFVDAYASWCGPCRKLSSEVFPNPMVGNFFNTNFINAKIDMEKGDGPRLKGKFGVRAYPTLVFLDPQGNIIHKTQGYHQPDMLIAAARKALFTPTYLESMHEQYKKGERSPEFLRKYLVVVAFEKKTLGFDEQQEYLNSISKETYLTDENMKLFFEMANDVRSPFLPIILDNYNAFEEKFGEKFVSDAVVGTVISATKRAVATKDETHLQQAVAVLHQYPKPEAPVLEGKIKLEYYRLSEKWEDYMKTATDFFKHNELTDSEFLNNMAWVFYEHADKTKELKSALEMVDKSIALRSYYNNHDTRAAILYRLKRFDDALAEANIALELGKAQGRNYKSTLNLIENIQNKLKKK